MRLSVEDRYEIEETVARYCHAMADRDAGAVANLFTPDGAVEAGWSDALGSATRIEGKSSIENWARDIVSYIAALRYIRIWAGNLLIEPIAADEATGRAFFLALGCDGNAESTGTFACRFRKIEGHWKLSLLRCVMDGTREETAAREALLLARMHHGSTAAMKTSASVSRSGERVRPLPARVRRTAR